MKLVPGTIQTARARTSLAAWAKTVFPDFETPAHVRKIIAALEDVNSGKTRRLLVNVPPGHGKSWLTSILFPTWYLGRHPDREVILTSYNAALATDFSRKARDAFTLHGERVFGQKVSQDTHSVEAWGLAGRRGMLYATGVGGPITGRRGSLILIDDPVKGDEDAGSETERTKLRNWYASTLRTRLTSKPAGAIVLIMTRWAVDDLAGHLLEEEREGGEAWTKLILPFEDEETGEPLWPERWTREKVQAEKKAVGTRVYSSLYQQRPTPPGGAILKREWFKTYRERPKCSRVVAVVDCAFKGTNGSDPVAVHVWGRLGDSAYLLDRVHGRFDFVGTQAAVRDVQRKWPEAKIWIEMKANGSAVFETLRKQGVRGLEALEGPLVQSGEEGRVHGVSSYFEAGRVFFPDPMIAPWVREVFDSLAAFPYGAHDEDPDCAAYALLKLMPGAVSYYTGALLKSPRQIREEAGLGDEYGGTANGQVVSWGRDYSDDADAFTSRRRC